MIYEKRCEEVIRQAGKLVLSYYGKGKQIEHKGEIDLVTNADKEAERYIIAELAKQFPEHGFIVEEEENQKEDAEHVWIIDPIDGTTNFVHDYPFFCISIALKKQGRIVLGMVYNPVSRELFHAALGRGAYLNRKPISVSSAAKLNKAMAITGFPYDRNTNPDNNLNEFNRAVTKVQAIRRDGSAALDLCYVASGRADVYWEKGLKIMDVAAGILIVQEAGGKVTDIQGDPVSPSYDNILASNGQLHENMLRILRGK